MMTSQDRTALPTSSKVLCAVYGVIAVAALIATGSQNAAYFDNLAGFVRAINLCLRGEESA